jgi:small subunit ribosomal protein S16
MKKHLLEGVKKGALTEAQMEQKFNKWLSEKDGKIVGKKDKLKSDDANKVTAQLKAEKVANEAKAAKIAAKTAVVAETKEEETPVNDTPIVDETSNEEKA